MKPLLKTAAVFVFLFAATVFAAPKTAKPAAAKAAGDGATEPLPAAKFAELKKRPCTLIHVWATWCTTCLQELPDLMKVLAQEKGLTPVVVDVSSPFVQENFSKKWIATLKAGFKAYTKPEGKDDVYLNAIDKDWSGTLPFSVLYHKGIKKKTWSGSIDLKTFRNEVAAACR